MKQKKWGIAVLLCLALTLGMLAGIPLHTDAAEAQLPETTVRDNELPIIPITPHTHTWDEGTVTTQPTCTAPGVMTYHCTTCSTGVKTEPIDPLGHAYQSAVTAPTCTAGGYTTYTCTRCGDSYVADETEALGHNYETVVTAPTCTAGGYTTYTCTRCGSSHIADELPALGHTPADAVEENRVAPTCTANGGYDTVSYCAVCGTELQRSHTDLPALGHDWDDGVVSTAPSCTGSGVTEYTCRRCGEKKTEAVSPAGHTSGEAAVENEVAATCTGVGGYDTVVRCTVCGAILSSAHTEIPALGHDYAAELTPPACLEDGFTTYTCTRCGDSYRDGETPALGHEFGEWTQSVAPTCTAPGMEKRTCSRCEVFETRELPATGHSYEAVVTAPTCTEDGCTTYTCANCGDSYQDQIVPATGHRFANGVCTVCGAKDPDYVPENPFTDVRQGQFFFDAVLWAVGGGITKGMSETEFAPEADCTRGQVVTFLWRAQGSPAPKSTDNPFEDVDAKGFYYKAVLWAVENKITAGLDKTHFGPMKACTRGQVVTFLWRAKGEPAVGDGALDVPFTDVSKDAFYYRAMCWAVENKITTGTGKTSFAPGNTCTRGQIVTFLYRAQTA